MSYIARVTVAFDPIACFSLVILPYHTLDSRFPMVRTCLKQWWETLTESRYHVIPVIYGSSDASEDQKAFFSFKTDPSYYLTLPD